MANKKGIGALIGIGLGAVALGVYKLIKANKTVEAECCEADEECEEEETQETEDEESEE